MKHTTIWWIEITKPLLGYSMRLADGRTARCVGVSCSSSFPENEGWPLWKTQRGNERSTIEYIEGFDDVWALKTAAFLETMACKRKVVEDGK